MRHTSPALEEARRPALPSPARCRRRGYPLHPRLRLAVHCAPCRPRAPRCGALGKGFSLPPRRNSPLRHRHGRREPAERHRSGSSGASRKSPSPRSRGSRGSRLPRVHGPRHREQLPLKSLDHFRRRSGGLWRAASLRKRGASPGPPRRRHPEACLRHPQQGSCGRRRSRFGSRDEGYHRLICAGTLGRLLEPCACPSAEAHVATQDKAVSRRLQATSIALGLLWTDGPQTGTPEGVPCTPEPGRTQGRPRNRKPAGLRAKNASQQADTLSFGSHHGASRASGHPRPIGQGGLQMPAASRSGKRPRKDATASKDGASTWPKASWRPGPGISICTRGYGLRRTPLSFRVRLRRRNILSVAHASYRRSALLRSPGRAPDASVAMRRLRAGIRLRTGEPLIFRVSFCRDVYAGAISCPAFRRNTFSAVHASFRRTALRQYLGVDRPPDAVVCATHTSATAPATGASPPRRLPAMPPSARLPPAEPLPAPAGRAFPCLLRPPSDCNRSQISSA